MMRVLVLGLRGFPEVQGGVESHAQHLYPLLVDLGCEVTVAVRSPYMSLERPSYWRGVRFIRLWSPRVKGLEAFAHTLLGVLYAAWARPDILHIHAVGPGLMVPLARMLGLRVVFTHHGPDYDRQKWGRFARWMLRMGEMLGVRYSNQRIAISKLIGQTILERYDRDCTVIYNGVDLQDLPEEFDRLVQFGLQPRKYVLLVSRLVPEKRHFDLVNAFRRANLPGWKLVFVGASDHPDEYTREILTFAAQDPLIVCTGFQTGETLRQLYGHAGVFVLPSSHEGLPIALLEALSYGIPTIASAIPANLEVGLDSASYFPLGDTESLARMLSVIASPSSPHPQTQDKRQWIVDRYDWRDIARQTLSVYRKVRPEAKTT